MPPARIIASMLAGNVKSETKTFLSLILIDSNTECNAVVAEVVAIANLDFTYLEIDTIQIFLLLHLL